MLKEIKKYIKKKTDSKEYEAKCEVYRNNEWKRRIEAYKYWTPELIEWVSITNDVLLLAVTSCLVNSYKWPDWLPSKPYNYNDRDDDVRLYFCVDLYKILKDKCEIICPGIYLKIRMTHYYNNYNPIPKQQHK